MKSFLPSMVIGSSMFFAGWSTQVRADFIDIKPSQDNSIYSENNNSNALGSLFAGRTNGGVLRRALLQFDLSSIPVGSTINSVSLALTQTRHGLASTAENFELHRLAAGWGQGTSVGSGQGAPPTNGDATWNFRQFSSTAPLSWTLPGGDFATTSGIATIGVTDNTVYTFSSQPGMVADVQTWVNTSNSNFGWILKTENETINRDARVFGSRESAIGLQPTLTVNFTAVPEPNSLNLLAAIGVATWAFSASRMSPRTNVTRNFMSAWDKAGSLKPNDTQFVKC